MTRGLVQLCLAPGAVDAAFLAHLIRTHDLGFEPLHLSGSELRSGTTRYGQKALDRLAAAGAVEWAAVGGEGGESFELSGVAGHHVKQILWQRRHARFDRSLIDAVVSRPGLNAGYLSDAEDSYWQSETSIEAYERRGRPHAHLPKTDGGFFPGEGEPIDVSGNPGRQSPFGGIWLFAAAEMWFGPGAFRYLDRERMLELPVGSVEQAAGATLHVELFPFDWYEANLDEVRARQRQFRDWMGFDELESEADDLLDDEPSDPVCEIETGAFPNGGVRLVTEWLDRDGVREVPRSRAERKRLCEAATSRI